MSKYFFLSNSLVVKLILGLFISLSFDSAPFFVVYFLVLTMYLALYRKNNFDLNQKENLEPNILLTPVSGKIITERNIGTRRQIEMKLPVWGGFGICMPISGEIVDEIYLVEKISFIKKIKTQIEIHSLKGLKIKMILHHYRIFSKKHPIWVRAGDRSCRGAYLGYLPFGGKVVIELPVTCEAIAKKGDYLMAGNTVFAINRG